MSELPFAIAAYEDVLGGDGSESHEYRHLGAPSQGRTDLVTDLWRLAQNFGFSEAYRNAVEVQAEIIVASIHGVAEALVDGRIHDVRMASVALAQGTIHATQTLFAAPSVKTSP